MIFSQISETYFVLRQGLQIAVRWPVGLMRHQKTSPSAIWQRFLVHFPEVYGKFCLDEL
jgi:hypothetical protein